MKHAEHGRFVHPIAGRRAPRRRHNTRPLVESERASAQARPLGHLSDEKTAKRHGVTINLALWGKVKTYAVLRR
jgi:hypothetical protein